MLNQRPFLIALSFHAALMSGLMCGAFLTTSRTVRRPFIKNVLQIQQSFSSDYWNQSNLQKRPFIQHTLLFASSKPNAAKNIIKSFRIDDVEDDKDKQSRNSPKSNLSNKPQKQQKRPSPPTKTAASKPKPPSATQKRPFSNRAATDDFRVPNKITIPQDQLTISFTRSGGAGGQNVNKVNTRVEIRFHLLSAAWMPLEVRQRLGQREANRVNKDGEFVVSSQEYRTQMQNRKDALEKLEEMVMGAYPRPKERKMRKGISKKAKERNLENKKRRSQTKQLRGRVNF